MSMANWQNEEKSHINEGKRRDDKDKSRKVGRDLIMASPHRLPRIQRLWVDIFTVAFFFFTVAS